MDRNWHRNRDKYRNKNQSTDSLDIYAAKLTYIGTSLSTLGDGIQTIAAGLALEALLNAKKENSNDQAKQNTKMKQQIDHLISELEQIKRILK
ncbi:translation initiation factor 2 [Lysinibacillus xylanilyticus]|uniref:translation initiation factor 2 n=1 Tax=Lysinibacillus xylanilyticus TaxID=582475 RepID=UPI003D01D92B